MCCSCVRHIIDLSWAKAFVVGSLNNDSNEVGDDEVDDDARAQ